MPLTLSQLDEDTVNISSPSLRNALALSTADRRWIDLLTQIINETWDDAHPERPRTLGYMGSEEFIRLQFEEYLLALLSCMKYHEELNSFNAGGSGHRSKGELQALNIEGDPALEFNSEFLAQWQHTSNYALFKRLTSDALLFSIVEPRHPCAGGLNMEDIQRRLGQQVADLHLDDRVREGRETLNRHLSTGQKKVSAAFNSFWTDIETMREAQRKRNEEKFSQSQRSSMDTGSPPFPSSDSASVTSNPSASTSTSLFGARRAPSFDITQTQASAPAPAGTVSQRAGAYLSSWGSWASEKRKEWQEKKNSPTSSPNASTPSTPTLGSITETKESDRGRRVSAQLQQRHSEDLPPAATGGTTLPRSLSRRKRWSNIILRRESGEFISPHGSSNDSSENDVPFPRSPLSREAPILGSDDAEANKPGEPATAPSRPGTAAADDKHEEEKPQPADRADSRPRSAENDNPSSPAAAAATSPGELLSGPQKQ